MPNGTTTITNPNPRADLDAWTQAIADLDTALTDAASARLTIDAETVTLDRLEAGAQLSVEGRNEAERKARLTLALADDGRYQTARRRLTDARQCLWDAERRVTIGKERCRLLRATVELAASTAA